MILVGRRACAVGWWLELEWRGLELWALSQHLSSLLQIWGLPCGLCVAGLGFLTAWQLQDGQLLPAADGSKDEYSVSKAEQKHVNDLISKITMSLLSIV